MTDLPALRVAVAETVPYCGQGETAPNAWARRERAERILLDAVPALLDEVEAARAALNSVDEMEMVNGSSLYTIDPEKWQAWQARAGKEQA